MYPTPVAGRVTYVTKCFVKGRGGYQNIAFARNLIRTANQQVGLHALAVYRSDLQSLRDLHLPAAAESAPNSPRAQSTPRRYLPPPRHGFTQALSRDARVSAQPPELR